MMERKLKSLAAAIAGVCLSLLVPAASQAAPPPFWSPSMESAYKATLFATNAADAKASASTFTQFARLWDEATLQYLPTPPAEFKGYTSWKETLIEASGHMHYTGSLIATGRLADAHAALEPLQYLMRDVRERNGIKYYGDILLAYHDAWEVCAHIVAAAAGKGLSDADVAAISEALPEMKKTWASVESFPLNISDPARLAQYLNLLSQNRAAIARVDEALKAGDKTLLAKAAAALKPTYASLYAKWDWEQSL